MGYEILLAFSCILIYNQNTRCRYEKTTDIQNIEEVVSQNTCGMTLFSPYGESYKRKRDVRKNEDSEA